MKEHLLKCVLTLAIVCLALPSIIESQRDNDACVLFAHGTKLRDPDDCSQEIICNNFKSTYGIKCSGSKPFYNKDTHKCETHLSDHSTCDISCKNMTGKFVEDPKSCYGYYYCQNEELALYGHCTGSLHFNQTRQSCIGAHESNCSIIKLNFCAIVSSGVKFKDMSHCGRYYECVYNKITNLVHLNNEYCSANAMYFDAGKGECVAEPREGCHPVPKNVCTVNKKIKKNYFVSDGATCRGSFYCADVGNFSDPNPKWNQCPDNKFFSQEKQACLNPKQVVCHRDRCEGSTKTFVISSERGCRHYLRCENGVKVGEGSCGNIFFDEEHDMCTPEIMTYPACYYK